MTKPVSEKIKDFGELLQHNISFPIEVPNDFITVAIFGEELRRLLAGLEDHHYSDDLRRQYVGVCEWQFGHRRRRLSRAQLL